MPSKNVHVHNLMEARAHGATFPMARKIPMNVAKEFVLADLGRHFAPPPKVQPKTRGRKR